MPISLFANENESSMAVFLSSCVDRRVFYLFLAEVFCRLPVKFFGRLVFEFVLGLVIYI